MAELTATITYPYDARILALFAAESKHLSRSSYDLTHDATQVVFSVKAQDATALRAALTTITKVLSVWEATRDYGSS